LTIHPVNDRPTLVLAVGDAGSTEDTPVNIAIPLGTFADVDGDQLVLTATLLDGSALPAWLSFDGTRLTGTPPADYHGSFDILVTASDSSLSASDSFRLTVTPVNDRPAMLTPLADVASDEDQAIDILLPAGTFADRDGDSLTLTALLVGGEALPQWLSFDGTRFTGTPPANFTGTLDIEVVASDGTLSVSDAFRLTVNPINDRPTLETLLGDVRSREDAAIDLLVPAGTFADVDGDALTLSATLAGGDPLPSWLSFDGVRFTGTPPANFNGAYEIEVTASDGAMTITDSFRLVIDPVNDRPVLVALLADVASRKDMVVDILIPAGSFADLDGDQIMLTATLADGRGLPAWLSFENGRLTGTPPAHFHGSFDIQVLASDGALAVSDVFRLTITPENDPPVLVVPLADAVFAEDKRVDILVPANTFVDADGDTLALSATLADGHPLPSWLSFVDGRFTGTPPLNYNGELDIRVTASDGALSTSDLFRLTILAVNDAPKLQRVLADVNRPEDLAVDITLPADSFGDVDGDALTLTARLANGNALPNWLHFDAGRFTGTPPANFNGFILIEVFANDGLLATSGTFRLTIDPVNDVPVLTKPIADAAVAEDNAIDLLVPAGTFGDVDGDALTLTAIRCRHGFASRMAASPARRRATLTARWRSKSRLPMAASLPPRPSRSRSPR
jgi:hypothetical protein